jgi:hypothetical protein
MILGMSTATYTLVHVILSLLGIISGFAVVYGLLTSRRMDGWTALFLVTTVATSVTGFGFPFTRFEAPHIVGVISLAVLAIAIAARYAFHLGGAWRGVYVIASFVALYLNVFVGVVQAFQKVPALHTFAPHGSEPPFVVTQFAVLALFIVLAVRATSRFRLVGAVAA